jgi:hypothetical protein
MVALEEWGMKVDGVEVTIGFVIGAALAYYAARHYFLTGKGA